MKLIVITDEGRVKDEVNLINGILQSPETTVHVRKKGWSRDDTARLLEGIDEGYLPRIVLHSNHELARQYPVGGLHYRFDDFNQKAAKMPATCSVHNWLEFARVQDEVVYSFVSPFFDSVSKASYPANPALWDIPSRIDKRKVAALGGVSATNIGRLKELGLNKAAVLGAVWKSADPVGAVHKLLCAWQ